MSKKEKHIKTNCIRIVESSGIEYETVEYDVSEGFVSGVDAAQKTGIDETFMYKTLVTEGNSRENYVFVIPVGDELDLRKAAKTVGEKKIEMIHMKDITKVTGYIKGGCSPVGMKKQFKTVIDCSALELERIYVSAGKPGFSMYVGVKELAELIGALFAELTV